VRTSYYRVTCGYVTSCGERGTDYSWLFDTSSEAIGFAKENCKGLRVTKKNGLTTTEEVLVEEIDTDCEPVGQPIFWVKADALRAGGWISEEAAS